MTRTFESIHTEAQAVYEQIRDMDRDHAVLVITEHLATIYSDGNKEMLDAVDQAFAKK